MDKTDSKAIKGIAILMMLFLHLFEPENTGLYQPLFMIGNIPIEEIVTRACKPVPFFFIVSGYGFSYINSQHTITTEAQVRRLWPIFTAYWLTLILFVTMATIMNQEGYPGSWLNIIGNITAYSCTYNRTMWFLFPYAIICISTPLIMHLIKSMNSLLRAFLLFALIYFACGFIISRYRDEIGGYQTFTVHILQCLQYTFPFVLGILLQKKKNIEHPLFDKLNGKNLTTALLLIAIIVARCCMQSQALDPFYAVVFIILLMRLPRKKHMNTILYYLGLYSMGMWMVHFYLCNILFKDFFYGMTYPIAIFSMLVICSYGFSYILTKVNKEIHQHEIKHQ